jgi:ribonuclease HII
MTVGRPVTRTVPPALRDDLGALFAARGHTLAKNPKNRYVAFEVRTAAKSIFTLYTSGKLVSTVRDGDPEGLILEDELANRLGTPAERPAAKAPAPGVGDAERLAGLDETGTGELLGSALVSGAAFPRELADAVAAVAGHVETKTSRAPSGWERLGDALAALRGDGLILTTLPIPNRLFDLYSKNALLDLTYVRVVANLIAAGAGAYAGMHLAVDDFGAGRLLRTAARGWAAEGAGVDLGTKADDRHLSARVASVWARSGRAREMLGIADDVDDGPIGTGNPGHYQTKAWLRRRAAVGGGWPSFVKASFSTVRKLDRMELVTKRKVPTLDALLGADGAAALAGGRLPLEGLVLPSGDGAELGHLSVDVHGACEPSCPAAPFLPLLFGGLVLDDVMQDLGRLDELLHRETGLASGWRVLAGPDLDPEEPGTRTLLAAHRRGVIQLEPTAQADGAERASMHGALRLVTKQARGAFCAVLT